jgi:hypothetical protein
MMTGVSIAVLVAFTLFSTDAFPATPEYEVKAADVFNFTKFFEWPKSDFASGLTLCICGKDPFQGFLDEAIQGKLVHGLPVVIKRLVQKDKGWDECQVLFIGFSAPTRIEAVLAEVRGHSIVTIGESDSFTEQGGMIGLVVDQGRVRFDINLAAIVAGHLQVSSRLLALGRTVKK